MSDIDLSASGATAASFENRVLFPEGEETAAFHLPQPERVERMRRAFVSFAMHLYNMKEDGEIQRPIEELPAFKAAAAWYDSALEKPRPDISTELPSASDVGIEV